MNIYTYDISIYNYIVYMMLTTIMVLSELDSPITSFYICYYDILVVIIGTCLNI